MEIGAESSRDDAKFSLRALALRSIAISLYRANARWRRHQEVARDLLPIADTLDVPPTCRAQLRAAVQLLLREVERWGERRIVGRS